MCKFENEKNQKLFSVYGLLTVQKVDILLCNPTYQC
jgi:hypothetical protein